MTTAIDPDIATCRSCGYMLRGLPTGRCPECGRHFDWNDPSSLNPGPIASRWARFALSPLGRGNWRLTCAAAAGMFWGWGCFPGGFLVFTAAFLLLLVLQLYGLLRLLARELALVLYHRPRKQHPLNTGRRYRTAGILIVRALAIFFDLPLHLSGNLTRLLAGRTVHRMYYVDPASPAPLGPRMFGPLLAREVAAWPNGVAIHTFAGRDLRYQPFTSHEEGIELGGGWYWVGTPSRQPALENGVDVVKALCTQPFVAIRYLIGVFKGILQESLSG